jgi:hypothetical protein
MDFLASDTVPLAYAMATAFAGLKPSNLLRRAADAVARWDGGTVDGDKIDRKTIEASWEQLKRNFAKTRSGHRVIYIIHDVYGGLGDEEATDLIDEIRDAGRWTHIDVILHTFGGGVMASDRVAEALLAHKRTTAYVPNYAMSGGTEIALATHKIVLGKHACLGPTDVQFGPYGIGDIEKLEEEKGGEALDDEIALWAIRAKRIAERDVATACRLINPAHKTLLDWLLGRCTLAKKLAGGEMVHSERITYAAARELHLNVGERLPKAMYELVRSRRKQLKQLRELERSERVAAVKTASANTQAVTT